MPKNFSQVVNSLKSEADKVQADLVKWSNSVKPNAEARIKNLEGKYKDVVKQLQLAQKDLHAELKRTMVVVKKHQAKLQQTLTATQKKTVRRKTTKKAATK
jgi:hypothetical protein